MSTKKYVTYVKLCSAFVMLAAGAYVFFSRRAKVSAELRDAVFHNDLARAQAAIDRGASINKGRTMSGEMPLMMAIENGYVEMVTLLIRNGVNLSKSAPYLYSPLDIAIMCAAGLMHSVTTTTSDTGEAIQIPASRPSFKDRQEIIKVLLQAKAPTTLPDIFIAILLHDVDAARKMMSEDYLQQLTSKERGEIPQAAIASQNKETIRSINDILPYFSERFSPIYTPDWDKNKSLLNLAIAEFYPLIVEYLLTELHVPVNVPDRDGDMPLHKAITEFDWFGDADPARVEIIKILLAHGAQVNARDAEGNTPLDLASRYVKGDAAQIITTLLIANGAERSTAL